MGTLLRLFLVALVFLAACSNPARQQAYAEQPKASEARVERYLREAEQHRLEWEAERRWQKADLQRLEEAVERARAEQERRRRRFYENLPALETQSKQIMCNWFLDAQASAIRLDDDRSDVDTIARLAVDGSRFGDALTRLWLTECYSYDMAIGYIDQTKKSILDYTTGF